MVKKRGLDRKNRNSKKRINLKSRKANKEVKSKKKVKGVKSKAVKKKQSGFFSRLFAGIKKVENRAEKKQLKLNLLI